MDKQKYKIGLVCRIAWPVRGGLTLHALRLAQELKKREVIMEIITRFTLSDTQGNDYFWRNETARSFDNEGITTHVISLNKLERLILWPVSRMRTREYLLPYAKKMVEIVMKKKFVARFRKYNLIHYDGGGIELMSYGALMAAKKNLQPFLVQPSIHINQWGNHRLDHELYKNANGLLVHTQIEKKYLIDIAKIEEKQIFVVGNGIDDVRGGNGMQFKKKYGITGKIILFIGRKSHDKGYDLLHKAFEIVAAKNADAWLVVAGPRSSEVQQYKISFNHPGKKRIIELDNINDDEKKDAYASCDVFCQPSVGESFGLVFLEAALCGKPVIGRNLEVLDELLGSNKAAYLIGNRKPNGLVDVNANDVADAILTLLSDENKSAELGNRAIRVAEHHLWCKVIDRFINAYNCYIQK